MDYSQLSLLPSLLKVRLVNEHREDYPNQFMGSGKHGHLVGQPLSSSFMEIGFEELVRE